MKKKLLIMLLPASLLLGSCSLFQDNCRCPHFGLEQKKANDKSSVTVCKTEKPEAAMN